ncbi:MAG: glycosyltransferase family 61 protein [Pseudomonadota bacterium]|nr:glycosyltransferase family 61 protein [Pseudomonadota bacterium]
MAGDYVSARVGGVHLHHRAENASCRDDFQRFAATAPQPPPADVLELDDVIFCNGGHWACLYDRDGRRIEAAALVRYDENFTPQFWRAAPTLPNTKVALTIAEPVVYAGVFFSHWGHFLLESAARLWAMRERPELGRLAALHTWRPARPPASIDAFLAAADLRAPVAEGGRIRLAKCFVPTPAFAYQGYADPRHLLAPHGVARRLLKSAACDERPVYLSRGRVQGSAADRVRVRNEAELEARLGERGALVVHMQDLTLSEQIALMNGRRTFIGLWGSAMHNTLFSLHGPQLSTFTLIEDGHRPANFLLVDRLVGAAAHYLYTVHASGDGAWAIDVEATLAYLGAAGAL